jgi:hypothetical protein
MRAVEVQRLAAIALARQVARRRRDARREAGVRDEPPVRRPLDRKHEARGLRATEAVARGLEPRAERAIECDLLNMKLKDADFEIFMEDLAKTLDSFKVHAREKAEVLADFRSRRADVMPMP